jgi:xanthine dehydrogenase molybdopterin-binding subunit B
MTIRPLVVSMTIAFCLSRAAGSGCAIAGAAQINAARTARIRIMKAPEERWKS